MNTENQKEATHSPLPWTATKEWTAQGIANKIDEIGWEETTALINKSITEAYRNYELVKAERDELLAALKWYASATYPDDGSGRPQDAYRKRAQATIAKYERNAK